MSNYSKHRWLTIRRLICAGGLGIFLIATAPAAWALAAQSYYPYAVDPTLPDAAGARQLVAESPWILRPFRKAHQQSLQRGWKSIIPPLSTVEDEVEPAASKIIK